MSFTCVETQDYSYQTFVPELSVGDIDAPIVTLNLPLIGVIETLHATVSGLALQTLLDLLVSIIARYKVTFCMSHGRDAVRVGIWDGV